jgi:AcrR family transcriptional regulator
MAQGRRKIQFEHVQVMDMLMADRMSTRSEIAAAPKSEETRARILNAALTSFRKRGFEAATMRDIARDAGVALGAAYYYFPSKDAIVMDFYRRSCEEMQPRIDAALKEASGLEERLRELIRVKLAHFAANRSVLRALLRNGADPKHPLSPFSPQTREIRDIDIVWFRTILSDCGLRIPKDLAPSLPDLLWFCQMGVIWFWVVDDSVDQARTARLLNLAAKCVASMVRASALPLMRPMRKAVLELVEFVEGL